MATINGDPPLTSAPAGIVPPPAGPAPNTTPRAGFWRHPAVLIALVALLLLGWQWVETRARISRLQEEVARRLAEADSIAKESRGLAKQSAESVEAAYAKLGALESKLDDAQSQQASLEGMYQEVTRTRDERLLAEVEHAINIALQQLQLAGNIPGALIALQSADAQLARMDRPQFLALRKALAHDIDRLKAVPIADVTGLSLKLENLVSMVDGLPLAFENAATPAPEPEKPGPTGLLGDIWKEFRSLMRIERLDRPDPVLLAPEQAFFLRENLKLRLLNARLALLQRDAGTFRDDLRAAQGWIERYYDGRAKTVQNAQATLRQLSGSEITLEVPVLNETVAALGSTRVSPEAANSVPAAPARKPGR